MSYRRGEEHLLDADSLFSSRSVKTVSVWSQCWKKVRCCNKNGRRAYSEETSGGGGGDDYHAFRRSELSLKN